MRMLDEIIDQQPSVLFAATHHDNDAARRRHSWTTNTFWIVLVTREPNTVRLDAIKSRWLSMWRSSRFSAAVATEQQLQYIRSLMAPPLVASSGAQQKWLHDLALEMIVSLLQRTLQQSLENASSSPALVTSSSTLRAVVDGFFDSADGDEELGYSLFVAYCRLAFPNSGSAPVLRQLMRQRLVLTIFASTASSNAPLANIANAKPNTTALCLLLSNATRFLRTTTTSADNDRSVRSGLVEMLMALDLVDPVAPIGARMSFLHQLLRVCFDSDTCGNGDSKNDADDGYALRTSLLALLSQLLSMNDYCGRAYAPFWQSLLLTPLSMRRVLLWTVSTGDVARAASACLLLLSRVETLDCVGLVQEMLDTLSNSAQTQGTIWELGFSFFNI
jgi:hypothetical protein